MSSFRATLELGGKEYDVLYSNYEFSRTTDKKGQPASSISGGRISVTIESTDDTSTIEAMLNSQFKPVEGKIIYKKSEEDAKMKEISFKNAYIVHYKETLDVNNEAPMTIAMTFSAENINVGATVSYMKDIDVRGAKKNAVFGEIGADVKFNDDWRWMAAVSKSNIKAYNDAGQKIKNDGVFTEVRYKLADWKVRNSYDAFLNYRRVGALSGVSSVQDYSKNVQGVQVGATYVPWKNWKVSGFYLAGKQVTPTAGSSRQDVNVLRGQVEYKF